MTTVITRIVWSVLVSLLLVLPLDTSPQCDHYGGCRNYPFLPAPPGRTPSCAKPGSTFCEKIDHYPTQLIRYLIEQWGYDYNTLFSDESRDDFNYRTPVPSYGPHHHPRGYIYGPPKLAVPISYYPLQLVTPAGPALGTGNASFGGYPDRRYKLPPHQQQFLSAPYLYTTLLQPAPVSTYNPDEWWARYARSNSKAEGNAGTNPTHQQPQTPARQRRQADGNQNQNQLCPTRKNFIMPKAAMNNQGNWMYVVNLPEVDDRLTQLVGTEQCVSNQCSGLCTIPNGYTSRCQQQFVQKRLVGLKGTGDELYTDLFWFPHCCVCQITQNG
ncbi:protein spaetzle 5 isoform X2 [Anabrus simplex]|uniref:protein spaetzle 5 isoform X2 n=1 Tax=Anabrus simplex TaxID=316456 RepID=UPI0034DDB290